MHFIRTAGLERWREVTASKKEDQARRDAALVHWGVNLLSKVSSRRTEVRGLYAKPGRKHCWRF